MKPALNQQKNKSSPTLAQIAENLGIHRSTVSICLSDSARTAKFSNLMRERVRAEADRLKYRPDSFASQLRKGKRKICLLGMGSIEDPHAGAIAESFIRRMEKDGYLVITTPMHPDASGATSRSDQLLATNLISSLCLITSSFDATAPGWVDALVNRDVSVVLIGRRSLNKEIIQVYCDERESGRQAMRHLAGQGYRKFGVICDSLDSSQAIYPRREGAISEAKTLGFPIPEILEVGRDMDLLSETANPRIQKWLAEFEGIDGIFASRDALAYSAIQAAARRGLAIGSTLGIMGHDDLWTSKHLNPPLSSIRQPLRRMGVAAAEMLLEKLASGRCLEPRVFPTEVIVRESTTRK